MKKAGPLEIFALLPQTNCKKCGEETCMAFAAKLAEHTLGWQMCTPIVEEEKYSSNKEKLADLMRPPIREVTIGVDEHAVKIGGKLVLYRHELRYNNPTPIFVDVTDTMPKDEVIRRVEFVDHMNYLYIGRNIHLDGIAIRSVSNDPKKFAETVSVVIDTSKMPLLLCSHEPKVIEAGLDVAGALRPLICSATLNNWKEMAKLAK
ncbi:MAG: (Fe-S)-binding protein, partial [Candidatus Ranarchaeia archaeon]